MQQEQRKKKVQEEGSATFHFVHSDMMKYLITDSEHRVWKEKGNQTHRQKWGREAETHEMQQKGSEGEIGVWREGHRETWTGFKVPRRNEQLEEKSAQGGVCVWCVCIHLYTDAYSYLVACL